MGKRGLPLQYGEVPLVQIRIEVFRAEDNYFATFNELNSADEYDIRCIWEAPTSSRIKQRVCRAKFVDDLMAEEAQALLRGDPVTPTFGRMQVKGSRLHQEMKTLVLEHPELLDALTEFDATKDRYESERERR